MASEYLRLGQVDVQPEKPLRLNQPITIFMEEDLSIADTSEGLERELVAVPDSEFVLVREAYDPLRERANEVINSLANGARGIRAVSEFSDPQSHLIDSKNYEHSHPIHNRATYIAGLFEQMPPDPQDPEISSPPDIVNIPNWQAVKLSTPSETLDIDKSQIEGYITSLDMKRSILTTSFEWIDKEGRKTKVSSKKFLSQTRPEIAAIQYKIVPLNYSGEISFETGFDGEVTNNSKKYLDVVADSDDEAVLSQTSMTRYSDKEIALAQKVRVSTGGIVSIAHPETVRQAGKVTQKISIDASQDTPTVINRIVASTASSENINNTPTELVRELVKTAPSFAELQAEQEEAWREKWQKSSVIIHGDEAVQKAIIYNQFKLMQLARENGGHSSIAAKGLDNLPGEGYMGHVFWDTEIFMMPELIHTQPEVAKSLLLYRYHTLDAAKEKARDHGYEGALYPWESADTGEETTPRKVRDGKGQIVDIYTGEREYHISGDIAYATWEYVKATGDEEFLRAYGAEMIAQTAKFWSSKAESDDEGTFHIRRVIGPDEYHEKGPDGEVGVNDNLYNNVLALWNIDKALEIWDQFADDPTVREKMGLTANDITQMKEVSSRLLIPYDPQTQLFEQFAGYHTLKYVDLANDYPGITAMDSKLKSEGKEPYEYQVIKQADVVLTLDKLGDYLFTKMGITDPQEQKEILAKNYSYYESRCSHGSSLSDATHVALEVEVGNMDKAYEKFEHAMTIDLNDTKLNNHFGTHAAALGGTLQAIISGFGGVKLGDEVLKINPKLPSHWASVQFPIRYQGTPVDITVGHDKVQLTISQGEHATLPVSIYGSAYNLPVGNSYELPLH